MNSTAPNGPALVVCALLLGGLALQPARAQLQAGVQADDFGAHFQSTYVWQRKPAFGAAYSGANSLSPGAEKSYTFSATAFLGVRLRPGTELYLDPEVIQGVPLSGLVGLGSPTNGEIQKVAGPNPKLYAPRFFVRQTWGLGGERETVESAPNQLAGARERRRVVLSAGKLAITDVFDANAYSHDPRSQFLTWASLAHGPFDYAADAQGYTWGAALEYFHDDWAVRIGRFVTPLESNGEKLNFAMGPFHGDQIELEHDHQLGGLPGAVRLLAWRNRENMGRYQDALDFAAANGGTPDVGTVRRPNVKRGWGLHVEQALADGVGAFARYGWADGQTETYSFEEVERSLQLGVQVKGGRWGRADDTLGLLVLRNELAPVHRQYLSQGGLGFFIGDGRLNYRPEQIVEGYYNIKLVQGTWLGLDVQHIANPAYNADRGPVRVYSLRLHAEF